MTKASDWFNDQVSTASKGIRWLLLVLFGLMAVYVVLVTILS